MRCVESLSQVSLVYDGEIANSVTDVGSQFPSNPSPGIAGASIEMVEITIIAPDNIHKLREAIEQNPRSFRLWHDLCIEYSLKGDLDGAVAACEAGLERIPENPAPMAQLQNLYAATGNYRKAIELSERLFATDPSLLAETFRHSTKSFAFPEPDLSVFLERCFPIPS
jgi:tetratricopeptide (TPR) repeat protein